MDNTQVHQLVYQVVDLVNGFSVKKFVTPPQTAMGIGAISHLGQLLKQRDVQRIFIVIDDQLSQMGLAAGMYRSLTAQHIEFDDFKQPKGEPDSDLVERMYQAMQQQDYQAVVAFGGGSVIDAAKAALMLLSNEALSCQALADTSMLQARALTFVAIPTTAGTGSEATDVAVITDSQTHVKHLITHDSLVPDIAILDACLTLPVPAHVTAATGIDALTHAIEAYVALNSTALTQALAHRAITLIGEALPIAVGQGSNIEAREKMMLASYMAGIAFSNAGLGLSHATAHRLGPAYNIAHGVANAIMLPSVMQFNLLVCQKAYAEIGLALTGKLISAQETIDYVQQLIVAVGLPANLQVVGAGTSDFEAFADLALADICIKSNPRQVDKVQIIGVFQHALTR